MRGRWRNRMIAFVLVPALLLSGGALADSRLGAGAVSPRADSQSRADIGLQLVIDYYGLGQFAVAVQEASLALQATPDLAAAFNPSANLNLSKLYFDRAELQKAYFHVDPALKNEVLGGRALWLAIRIERKLGNQVAENDLVAQSRQRYPSSSEYAAYQRGVFDE